MERPAKRPRLLTPLKSFNNEGFGNQHAYYDTSDDELRDYEEVEDEDEEPVYDPDQELLRKRAHVDFKLKSTFEAIFEKYGRDFDGIGDEIDMRTGGVVVNNGHLLEMRHEMDAGDTERSRSGQRPWSEEEDDDTSGSEEENALGDEEDGDDDDDDVDVNDEIEEEDEEDEEDYDDVRDGDMMAEDDMILRGFAQASQQFKHRHPHQDPGPLRDRFEVDAEGRHRDASRALLSGSVLPSRSKILAQFGPQLGPEIVKYVSERELEERNIEPAWRIPDIVPTAPSSPPRRPFIKPMVRQPSPEPERSPSPENAPSIWAVTTSKPQRKRFSRDEDDLLLEFVSDAIKQGLNLSSRLTWKQLEAMNPRHDWNAWKSRYTRKYTSSHPHEESDLSTSETSKSTGQIPHDLGFRPSFTKPALPFPSQPVDHQRPTRVRKPAQREGTVSWSEAVATIASVDPIGNAGLLDDVRRTTGLSFMFKQPVSSFASSFPTRRHSLEEKISKQSTGNYAHGSHQAGRLGMRADPFNGAEDELTLNDPAFYTPMKSAEKAPCHHADCRPYSSTLYRLERRYDEKISPMSSHLLSEHRIAPFPCGELNCERKESRGYFVYKDLVRHVEEAHPYATALRRLRGRGDPDLVDQSNTFDQQYESIKNRRPTTSYQRPRDCDFMSPQKPCSSHGPSNWRRFSFDFDPDPDRTLTPPAEARAFWNGTSSMRVHPSSPTIIDRQSVPFRQGSSDSDLQLLNGNPFLKSIPSRPEEPIRPNVFMQSAISKKLGPHLQGPSRDSFRSQEPKTPCQWLGCGKMISTHSGNMAAHLRIHEKHLRSSIAAKNPNHPSKAPLPASLLNLRSSTGATQPSTDPQRSTNGESSRARAGAESNKVVADTFVDRSYDFSDEEDGIRPVIRRQASQTVLGDKPPPLPQSFFAAPPKVRSSQSVEPPMPPSDLSSSNPFPKSKPPFATPASKVKPQKAFIRDVLDSEEFDELSLGEDGFVLLSARPKAGALPNSTLPTRVKREEEAGIQVDLATSSKKRTFSSLEDDSQIDELAEDGPSMSTPFQLGLASTTKHRPKMNMEEPTLLSMRPIAQSNTTLDDRVEATNPRSTLRKDPMPVQTPTKQQHQSLAKTSTPLIDLIKQGQHRQSEGNQSIEEIPSTAEQGSSPKSQRVRTRGQRGIARTSSPLTALVTPRKKTWAGRTVKQEEEEGNVVTPGGTLRRCGQNGFVCGRAFCFRCRTVEVNVA